MTSASNGIVCFESCRCSLSKHNMSTGCSFLFMNLLFLGSGCLLAFPIPIVSWYGILEVRIWKFVALLGRLNGKGMMLGKDDFKIEEIVLFGLSVDFWGCFSNIVEELTDLW